MTRIALLLVMMVAMIGPSMGCEGDEAEEDAPLITTDNLRPHADRGPCTRCHIVAPSTGAIPRAAPLIAAYQIRPHPDRGSCAGCHAVTGL